MSKKDSAKRTGRPPVPRKQALGAVFSGRLRADEAREVQRAIDGSGQSRSAWVREALLEKARRK